MLERKPLSQHDTSSARDLGPPIPEFFIPATASLQERRPRTLKHGDTFAVFDHNGDALAGPRTPEGIFHRDTRHISHFYLSLMGARPLLLSSTIGDNNATLTCDLTNPDLHDENGHLVLGHDLLHINRSRFLWQSACYERIVVRNFDDRPHKIRLELAFGADFADLFEVRGAHRHRRGTLHEPDVKPDAVTLAYTGLDRQRRETRLYFDPAPAQLTADTATYHLEVPAGGRQAVFLEIRFTAEPLRMAVRKSFFCNTLAARRALRASSSRAAAIVTSNDILNEGLRRSISDLYMLITDTPWGPYPYAGIPWFSTAFGRDAIVTALETLWIDPEIARGVLAYLAAHQAMAEDPAADAEPGKIVHEMRHGEMANRGEVPFRQYYGSVDATPLFVVLGGAYLARTNDVETIRQIWPNIQRALDWIDQYGDRDGDGFVEYGRRASDGLTNQGWKDSQDSVFHADGELARGPIAIVEVQAYVYGAWMAAAEIAGSLGFHDAQKEFLRRADDLRRRFDEHFWDDELGIYVLALDGDKKPCRVRTSNAGHALFTGISLPHRAARVVQTLMSHSSFSGWGVRTVASGQARYNPMSYHNGSVWPHDNALIAAGFARYGFNREASRLFEGQFAASVYLDLRRLPELFCGFSRHPRQGPTLYPVACAPQAWAAAAPLSLIQSCMGLSFNPKAQVVIFEQPALPDFLDEIVLRNLSIGKGRIDVTLRRAGGEVAVHVLSRHGDVRVNVTT